MSTTPPSPPSSPLAPPPCSDAPIWDVFLSAFQVPALVLADELGLYAALAAAPRTTAELADAAGVEPRAIDAIAGTLAALRLFTLAEGRFHLSEVARTYLVPTSPYYWGGMLRRIRDNPLDCRRLLGALRQGRAAADARVTGIWEAPAPPPEALVAFTHAMHAHSFALAMRVVPAFELPSGGRLLDVAGGSGSYSIAALHHDRALHATLLDLPPVCGVAAEYATAYGVDGRIRFAPANMFTDPWPTDHDRVLMSDIFHDWDDERCRWLAERARGALRPGGRLILHEMLIGDGGDGPLQAVEYSMAMLFSTHGRQRSARELAGLLTAAGLTDVRVTLTQAGYAAVSGGVA
ncbi:MAG TPA: methyltransferase [Kofleriaceae bacterium]|nr:methyltransferase [Kofleriaceae bacterium]